MLTSLVQRGCTSRKVFQMKLKLFLSKEGNKSNLSLENSLLLLRDLYTWYEGLAKEIISTIDVCIADSNDLVWWGYRERNSFTVLKVIIKLKDGPEIKAYKIIGNDSHIKPPLDWFRNIPDEPKVGNHIQKGKPLPELLTEQLKEYFRQQAESSKFVSDEYLTLATSL